MYRADGTGMLRRNQNTECPGDPMAKHGSPLENEAAQSTTALGPLVGLAREDFVGAVALLLRETASDPGRALKHTKVWADDVVKIGTG